MSLSAHATASTARDPATRRKPGKAKPNRATNKRTQGATAAAKNIPQPRSCACGGICPRCKTKHRPARKTRTRQHGAAEAEADRMARLILHDDSLTEPSQEPATKRPNVKERPAQVATADEIQIAQTGIGAGGRNFAPETRTFFETRFGRNFGNVALHTGPQAADSAQSLGAMAYAFHHHIVFADGIYHPNTVAGKMIIAHELVHVMQQEGGRPAIQRLDDGAGGQSEPLRLDLRLMPEPTMAAAPEVVPFPEGRNRDDFFTSGGKDLWLALERAWTWAASDPEYAGTVLLWMISTPISWWRTEADNGAGAADLARALENLTDAIEAAIRGIDEASAIPDQPRLILEPVFAPAADRLQDVDQRLPDTQLDSMEEVAAADPLLAVYLRHFPSEERPSEIDFNMRTRLAIALSEKSLPEAVAEAALEAVRSPFFIPMVVLPLGVYVALWVAPDFTITKVAAGTLTAILLTMFAWNDIVMFAWEWAAFNKACQSASTEEDIRAAGTRFTEKVGQVGFDILFMCMFWGLGKAVGPKLQGRAAAIETSSARSAPPAPTLAPAPKGYQRVKLEGGWGYADAAGNVHARVSSSGKVEFVSRTLANDVIAFMKGGEGAPAATGRTLLTDTSASQPGAAPSRTSTPKPPASETPQPSTGGSRSQPAATPAETAGGRSTSTQEPATAESRLAEVTENDLIVQELLNAIDDRQLPVLFSEAAPAQVETPFGRPMELPAVTMEVSAVIQANLPVLAAPPAVANPEADLEQLIAGEGLSERPQAAELLEAREAMRTGTATTRHHEILLAEIVVDARAYICASSVNMGNPVQPLRWDVVRLACGLSRDVSTASLGSLTAQSAAPIRVDRFHSLSVFGNEFHNHSFSVVTFPDGTQYLVDATFAQFQSAFMGAPDTGFVTDLLRDGFVPMDDFDVELYATFLRRPSAPPMAEIDSSAFEERLRAGDLAITSETIGAGEPGLEFLSPEDQTIDILSRNEILEGALAARRLLLDLGDPNGLIEQMEWLINRVEDPDVVDDEE